MIEKDYTEEPKLKGNTTLLIKNFARPLMQKVPEVTVFFWIIKLLSTGMGETTSDFLVKHINPYVGVVIGGIGFVIALSLQFAVRRYIPWVYWLAVVMVAVFGTMVADVLHVELGVPYLVSSTLFFVGLIVIFVIWYRTEKTLSVHSINTRRREFFYWATVIATFALGTATGDMTAYTLGLGFFASGLLFVAVFAIPAIGYWLFGLNEIVAFWFAYIITRPIGASFADWLGRPTNESGVGVGTGQISLILAVFIAILVGYLTIRDTASGKNIPRK